MASITFSVKLDTERDAALIEWLQEQDSKSYQIKAALYAYLQQPCPEPPPTETAAPAPAFDMTALTQAIIDGISQGNANLATALEQAVRNGLQGIALTVASDADDGQAALPKSKQDKLLDDMLSGLEDWMQ